jgi:hypothetical protein
LREQEARRVVGRVVERGEEDGKPQNDSIRLGGEWEHVEIRGRKRGGEGGAF